MIAHYIREQIIELDEFNNIKTQEDLDDISESLPSTQNLHISFGSPLLLVKVDCGIWYESGFVDNFFRWWRLTSQTSKSAVMIWLTRLMSWTLRSAGVFVGVVCWTAVMSRPRS